jgi:probable rRNA maturation factor
VSRFVPPTVDAFELSISATTGRALVPFLRRHVIAARRALNSGRGRARGRGCGLRELSVALVGAAKMSALHERFMHLKGPTDVLTFPRDGDSRGRTISGEVVVCVPQARRRAAERGISMRAEVLLYAVHGMLHLCGYDDRTDRDYRLMHRTEDQILSRLGFGPVFSGTVSGARAGPRPRRAARLGERRK